MRSLRPNLIAISAALLLAESATAIPTLSLFWTATTGSGTTGTSTCRR